jgi:BASS family bile acid:Na+ symporter
MQKVIILSAEVDLMNTLNKISDFFSKYRAVLVVIIATIALVKPPTFSWVTPHISFLLGIVRFGMGMTLKIKDFREVFLRPKDVFIGALAQFTIMPALAFCLAKIFSLPPELAAGVILVGTCPGGTSSNVMTYLAKGDVALSVSMTMTTTILAPIVTPVLTWLLVGAWLEISLSAMMISICQIVVVPIILGIAVNALFEEKIKKFSKLLPLISIIAIVLIEGGVVAVNAQKILEVGLIIAAVVMIHNLLGYGLGFVLAKFSKMNMSKSKAISIEVGMQNSGLATSLAMLHFGAAAAIPGAIFSVWHNISGAIFANILAKYNDK